MNFDLIAGLVLSSLAAAGKPKALELLQSLHDKNVNDYKAAIFVGNAALAKLKTVTDKSTTTIDDALVADVQDIINSSASANGITL